MDDEQDKPNQTIRIYVGAERRARMARLTDNVNWSALAQAVFDRAIELQEWRTMEDGMAKGLERLKAELKMHQDAQRESGLMAGRKWAVEHARIEDLMEVAKLQDTTSDYLGELQSSFGGSLPGCFRDDAGDSFAEGFIDGAAEVLAEVEA
jgi:hypothetical protein